MDNRRDQNLTALATFSESLSAAAINRLSSVPQLRQEGSVGRDEKTEITDNNQDAYDPKERENTKHAKEAGQQEAKERVARGRSNTLNGSVVHEDQEDKNAPDSPLPVLYSRDDLWSLVDKLVRRIKSRWPLSEHEEYMHRIMPRTRQLLRAIFRLQPIGGAQMKLFRDLRAFVSQYNQRFGVEDAEVDAMYNESEHRIKAKDANKIVDDAFALFLRIDQHNVKEEEQKEIAVALDELNSTDVRGIPGGIVILFRFRSIRKEYLEKKEARAQMFAQAKERAMRLGSGNGEPADLRADAVSLQSFKVQVDENDYRPLSMEENETYQLVLVAIDRYHLGARVLNKRKTAKKRREEQHMNSVTAQLRSSIVSGYNAEIREPDPKKQKT
jgi:hypothetical protein